MKTSCFEAVIDFNFLPASEPFSALIVSKAGKSHASLAIYKLQEERKSKAFLVQIHSQNPLSLKWGDVFEVIQEGGTLLGRGRVINPFSSRVRGKKLKKRLGLLFQLEGDEKEMITALARERGIRGLREKEILDFARISRASLRRLAEELEAEDKVRIISFSPLFIIWQQSLCYLEEKLLAYLEQFHSKHPGERGISRARIKKRFNLSQKVLLLVLERLIREKKVEKSEEIIALASFKLSPTPEEERVLSKLEEMCLRGELRSVSQEELARTFHLSPEKLNKMLSLLVERKKIVQGKEGFFIHSKWLEETVTKVRSLGKKELTVTDFKTMTGLSRKYAIPLLELLDQMGVTRRVSPSRREII
ncbi:MAG: SelB C-terminal domain-containing protein [Candidatus Aminicenantales bacterium]